MTLAHNTEHAGIDWEQHAHARCPEIEARAFFQRIQPDSSLQPAVCWRRTFAGGGFKLPINAHDLQSEHGDAKLSLREI